MRRLAALQERREPADQAWKDLDYLRQEMADALESMANAIESKAEGFGTLLDGASAEAAKIRKSPEGAYSQRAAQWIEDNAGILAKYADEALALSGKMRDDVTRLKQKVKKEDA